jgi:uncharacterized membrane protein YebE (DUF533 family)
MFDPQKILTQVLGGQGMPGKSGGMSSDLLKGGAVGGIAGLLLGSKGGRKLAGSALKVGGMAVLGGLAYKVYNDWQASKQAQKPEPMPQDLKDITPKAEGTVFLPTSNAERDELSRTLLSAMIAAAKADGHIDAAEQTRIFQKLDDFDLSSEEKGFVLEELRKPLDINALASKATTPERALEIYAASLLAIDVDGTAERDYLQTLATRLGLDPLLTKRMEQETEKVTVAG